MGSSYLRRLCLVGRRRSLFMADGMRYMSYIAASDDVNEYHTSQMAYQRKILGPLL